MWRWSMDCDCGVVSDGKNVVVVWWIWLGLVSGATVVQEVEKSFSNQKVASSIPHC